MRATMLVLLLVACHGDEPRKPFAELMKECSHGELSCSVPIFNVTDLRRSQTYFRDALGFKVEWDHGDPPSFGAVRRGDAIIFLCQSCQSSRGAWMMTFTRDVDRLHDEFVKRGAIIKMPPTNMEWDVREMHVADPDGNVIRFGGPTSGKM